MNELTMSDATPAADATLDLRTTAPVPPQDRPRPERTLAISEIRSATEALRSPETTLFTSSVDRVLAVMEAGIDARAKLLGELDRSVINKRAEVAYTLRGLGHHLHAIPRLVDVIVASQRADLTNPELRPSSDTLQAKHALRDSLTREPVSDEIVRRTYAERSGLRGPGSTGFPSLEAAEAEFSAIAGFYDAAIALATEVRDDLRAEHGDTHPSAIVATARLLLIAAEAEDSALVTRTLDYLGGLNADVVSQALHGGLGAWERDRFSALQA
jgi:hypothetical protein